MISILRKIRKRLLSNGSVASYLFYAIGEIALVVIGILIALQVNTWNSNRIQQAKFQGLLEQIYNALWVDAEVLQCNIHFTIQQIDLINQLLNAPASIPDDQLITTLYYIDENLDQGTLTKARDLLPFLDYNTGGVEQRGMTREILSYCGSNLFNTETDQGNLLVTPELISNGIPKPLVTYILTGVDGFTNPDFFEAEDIQVARNLLKEKDFRSLLLSIRSEKEKSINFNSNDYEGGIHLLQMIQESHPDVRLLFDDIGIIGNALETGWASSVPMNLVSEHPLVWELEISLKKGELKFRNRNSWSRNWGGLDFPKGKTLFIGNNISVEAGRYLIRLNLDEQFYEFIAK